MTCSLGKQAVLCLLFRRCLRSLTLSRIKWALELGSKRLDVNLLTPTVVADKWELPLTCLKFGRVLGSGAFGQVVKGKVSSHMLLQRGLLSRETSISRTHVTVAIKMLQEFTEERYRQDFLKEIKMMKDIGYHKNVVSILGCCTLQEPLCLVVEHVPYGDLLAYLRKIRQKLQKKEEENGSYVNQEVEYFSPIDLLSIARQIAVGMEFLSQKNFIHRDLAARNILVGHNKMVKIGDFGLTRYIYDDVNKVYVNRRGGKLPLKWMSIEAIFELTFSTASDVWAFGVVLFEIVTLGGSPYPRVANSDFPLELRRGYRMEKPDTCSQEIYELMLACWRENPKSRPSFSELRCILEGMLQESSGANYLDFAVDKTEGLCFVDEDTGVEECIVKDMVAAVKEKCLELDCSPDSEICKKSNLDCSKCKIAILDSEGSEIDHENYFCRRHNDRQDIDQKSGSSSSSTSDEVFVNETTFNICNKTQICLTKFDLHLSDGNDSAFSSSSSDVLSIPSAPNSDSSSTSGNDDGYLQPISTSSATVRDKAYQQRDKESQDTFSNIWCISEKLPYYAISDISENQSKAFSGPTSIVEETISRRLLQTFRTDDMEDTWSVIDTYL